jgi:hypothetical protein
VVVLKRADRTHPRDRFPQGNTIIRQMLTQVRPDRLHRPTQNMASEVAATANKPTYWR